MGDEIAPVSVADPNANFINLRVIEQFATSEMYVSVKRGAGMNKMMKSYADHCGYSVDSLHFVFKGRIITDDDTLESLEMQQGDFIEVFTKEWYATRESTKGPIWMHAIELTTSLDEIPAEFVDATSSDFVMLRMCEVAGNDIHFQKERGSTMDRLKRGFAGSVGINVEALRFFYNDRVVNDDDTPASLGMKEGDIIEAESLDEARTRLVEKEQKKADEVNKRWRSIQEKELREKEEKEKEKNRQNKLNKRNKKNANDESDHVDEGERAPHSRMQCLFGLFRR